MAAVNTLREISETVARVFNIDQLDISGPDRKRKFSEPRQLCFWAGRRFTNKATTTIAYFFNRRDHTTVLYGINRVPHYFRHDPEFERKASRVLRELKKKRDARGESPFCPTCGAGVK